MAMLVSRRWHATHSLDLPETPIRSRLLVKLLPQDIHILGLRRIHRPFLPHKPCFYPLLFLFGLDQSLGLVRDPPREATSRQNWLIDDLLSAC
ncbi:hypothetical protein HYPSUDRAFT_46253 [Hypholoma sublateritium FD-334 SS-4]|uniref:Uncharacterized protein n=1 Tax=Hypholoma sublateritium (strain FD-334 SS-4) TaxID=945553 RepID=A0A0D2PBD8_HYPSF|nr:hypothetical protein HYPSUDRAFT_46253 [Hypholoma sublateritium FD-334 SS-4]